MHQRCFDEERAKFNSLTATIKLSKERQTKPAYLDTNIVATKNTKMMTSGRVTLLSSHAGGNKSTVAEAGSSLNPTKSKDFNKIRKQRLCLNIFERKNTLNGFSCSDSFLDLNDNLCLFSSPLNRKAVQEIRQ